MVNLIFINARRRGRVDGSKLTIAFDKAVEKRGGG